MRTVLCGLRWWYIRHSVSPWVTVFVYSSHSGNVNPHPEELLYSSENTGEEF